MIISIDKPVNLFKIHFLKHSVQPLKPVLHKVSLLLVAFHKRPAKRVENKAPLEIEASRTRGVGEDTNSVAMLVQNSPQKA